MSTLPFQFLLTTLAAAGACIAPRRLVPFSEELDGSIEFDRPVGLFEFIRLKHMFEELTRCRVDLVTPEALRPALRETILGEAVYVA
jgi:hypothetical protein